MAARVLSAALLACAAALLVGCPHDWSSFEGGEAAVASGPDGAAPAPSTPPASSAPDVLATLGEHPVLLRADGEGLVFSTREGSILACPHTGCSAVTSIASAQRDIRGLAVASGFVAWGARGDERVRRAPRTPGGGSLVEAFEDDGIVAVALTPAKVYFAVDAAGIAFGAPGVRSCAPDADCVGAITYASFADGLATEIVVDGADAFWLGEHRVLGCPLATCDRDVGARTVLADEPVVASALAVDATEVLYASSLDGGSVRAVARSALASGGVPRTVASGVGSVTSLALTAASVWITNAAAGTVTRAPRTGGAPVVVASGLAAPTGIAAAAGRVYVACAGDGRILRWSDP